MYMPHDLTDKAFKTLIVVRHVGQAKDLKHRWLCRCTVCGKETTTTTSALTSGVKSCWCQSGRRTHQRTKTHLYFIWKAMKQRCLNPKHTAYKNYGGRGIKICEKWIDSFDSFAADMGEPEEGLTLDRIDTNRNYEPSNCRWSKWKPQERNRRNNVKMMFDGELRCITEIAEILGIPSGRFRERVKKNYPPEILFRKDKIKELMGGHASRRR